MAKHIRLNVDEITTYINDNIKFRDIKDMENIESIINQCGEEWGRYLRQIDMVDADVTKELFKNIKFMCMNLCSIEIGDEQIKIFDKWCENEVRRCKGKIQSIHSL